jgi:hypothetical protein
MVEDGVVTNVAAKAASLLSRGAATDLSHWRRPVAHRHIGAQTHGIAGLLPKSCDFHSPPKLGGDAIAQRGLGRSVQRRTVPINKVRFAGIYKEPLRGTLNKPPRLRLRRSLPSLLRRGMDPTPFGQQPRKPVAKICRRSAALIGCASRDILENTALSPSAEI